MPDLNDFYAFKTTSSSSGLGGGRNNTGDGNGSGTGCVTTLIVLAIIGWVLCLIGK